MTYFDDKANEEKKRKPRAFYGRERYFKKYDKFEADLLNNLKVFDDGKYAFDNFIKSFTVSENKGTDNILIVTFEHVIYYSQSKKKLLFVIEPENINSIEKETIGMKIIYSANSQLKDITLLIKNNERVQEINNTVNDIRYATLCRSLQL